LQTPSHRYNILSYLLSQCFAKEEEYFVVHDKGSEMGVSLMNEWKREVDLRMFNVEKKVIRTFQENKSHHSKSISLTYFELGLILLLGYFCVQILRLM